jgi:pimeloyl-ACP methyl ester carboxylesterase
VHPEQIACNGLTFDLLTAGPTNGQPVLLLNGFPEFKEQWTAQLEALADAGYRGVAIDQRGYSPGARPSAVSDYQVWHLVSDVIAIADALGYHRFHIVGHDWGGCVAWTLASLHADRLRSLTVFSTPHTAELHRFAQFGDQKERLVYVDLFRTPVVAEDTFLANDAAVLRSVYEGKVPPDRVELFVRRLSEPGALTCVFNWYRALDAGILLVPLAGRVTVSTAYVYSTKELAIGPDAARATAAWVDAPYRFEIWPGLTHWLPEEAPEKSNRFLLQHLRENSD